MQGQAKFFRVTLNIGFIIQQPIKAASLDEACEMVRESCPGCDFVIDQIDELGQGLNRESYLLASSIVKSILDVNGDAQELDDRYVKAAIDYVRLVNEALDKGWFKGESSCT